MIYQVKDLKEVKSYFRGNAKYGRTTQLVHVPTGKVLFEVMGDCPKGRLHIQFLDRQCKINADLLN